jgi:hypothetical protein
MNRPYLQTLCLLFLLLAGKISAQAIGDYQSAGSGNWNALATWQTWNGSAWIAAVATPTSANGVITIQAGHTVTITANVTIDDVVVNGTLTSSGATPTTINNGAAGVDLTINGTFIDNYAAATNVITWSAGATWQMGASGTLVKTTASSSNNWQSTYQGGIANIPASSNWIIRRNTAVAISFSSTTPASGSVYPNLTVENNVAGTWSTAAASSITGTTAFVTIKGNLDIGGSGTSTVDFANNNTNASPTLVQGNVTIRTGNTLRNYGTGLSVQGNLIVNGTLSYDANDGRKLIFSGGNYQVVSGTGTMNIYDMTLSKTTGTVTLNRTMTVDNLSTFTQGVLISSATNLFIVASTGTVTGANNLSFVDGPVRYLGSAAFTFPVGKNADYQAIGISGFSSGYFWTENFNNGCTSGCLASSYSGPNGAWTVSSTGTNDASANVFFVSCAENGNAVGACGTGCGSNATLHIGNVSTSPAAFLFCPSGDCGAAYDAGLGSNNVRTSWRAESPTINCTGYSNIQLAFRYMENGSGTTDNATAWYFDGTTWTQIADMAKTATTCGGGQGLWTQYNVMLPASANNNPSVKVGFQWVNNDDGAGSDPSFAVDVIQLGTMDYFTAEYFYANPQLVYNNVLAPTLGSIDACEYWILDRSAGSTASTSVTLTWDANTCPAIPAVTDTRVAHFDLSSTSTWLDEGNSATTGTTAAGTVTSAAPVTFFSPFTIGLIPSSPLPVELVKFNGECKEGAVQLSWITASESNNDYFAVERSSDGQSFVEIGRVNGFGSSSQQHNYQFTDPFSNGATIYYRLRQTDYNGTSELFPAIPVKTAGCGEVKALVLESAWMGADNLHLRFDSPRGPAQVEVFSSNGTLVASAASVPPGELVIASSSWSSGLYFIRISDGYSSVSRTIIK